MLGTGSWLRKSLWLTQQIASQGGQLTMSLRNFEAAITYCQASSRSQKMAAPAHSAAESTLPRQ